MTRAHCKLGPEQEPPAHLLSRGRWLEVWLAAGSEGQVFTYSNPGEVGAAVGDLVRVRLQGKGHAGLVVACADTLSVELEGKRILAVEAVLQRAAIDPDWMAFIGAVADRCHASLFRTLRSALPPGWLGHRAHGIPRQEVRVSLTEEGRRGRPEGIVRGPHQRRVLDHLRRREEQGQGDPLLKELVAACGTRPAVVRALEAKQLLRCGPVQAPGPAARPSTGGSPAAVAFPGEGAEVLTAAQAAALEAIQGSAPGSTFLLWGVTGAGKTEVYLRVAAAELAAGRSVLLLAPEIGLIPQLLDRCRERLGPAVEEYHSGCGEGERVRTWRRCLAASAAATPLVVVGTRSAVFLPLDPLGLIVLDEEHDGSYKQERPMPCYHARDVARLRIRRCGGRLLLGSATPSLETWLSCRVGSGDTTLLRLPERIGRRPLPPVRIIDMRLELAEGHRHLLSRALMERLQSLRRRGEQAVILVPRRGYRSFLSCRSCGEVVLCPHCDVVLTVHRHGGGQEWLRCHWCNHRQAMTQRCGHCGSSAFRPFGAGTQRVMELLGRELQDMRLLRFDQDTTRGREGHRRVLDRFAAGEADVLVGTQMLAKGMDLPRVTLAAVLAADGLLHRPDLRSSEQCLQLLLQLAGRAGRGERPGEVLVQTYCPDHPVLRHLVDGRYERFLEEELSLRRQGGLVPFRRACLLRLAGPVASRTATAAATLAEHLRPGVEQAGWMLVGPAPAPIARVAGRSRWQLLLHGPAPEPGCPGAGEAPLPLPSEGELRRILPDGVTLAIDPDPLEL